MAVTEDPEDIVSQPGPPGADDQPDPTGDQAETPGDRPETADDAQPADRSRYDRIEVEGKAHLVCAGAPNVRLHVERGLTVTESSRKRHPRQSVFLDGVYGEGPLFDNEARHYSLDHHSGCHRPITLATCEQAAVMLLSGLPLDEGEWQLHINEPDLDAVLAAWLLLNHRELLRDGTELLWQVMPLVRVEGVIDAHGLDRGPLAGVGEAVYRQQRKRIDTLLARERELKETGQWPSTDLLDYAAALLDDLDAELYPEGYLEDLLDIAEVAQVPIGQRSRAILCRAKRGIYAVESVLKLRYDKQLGVIVLDQGNGRFTVRQVDSFLPKNLGDLYTVLNSREPSNGANETNRWGGSADIGGSPRQTGTALDGEAILRAVQDVYGGGGWLRRMVRRITS